MLEIKDKKSTDEELVRRYCEENATGEEKKQIHKELQVRYYPRFEIEGMKSPAQGIRFKKRVIAVLCEFGVRREQMEDMVEKCGNNMFNQLFMEKKAFEKLLYKFKPDRLNKIPENKRFLYWVINVRLRPAIIDWLRNPDNQPIQESIDEGTRQFADQTVESQAEEAWMWWDRLLVPRHGAIIHLLHLAYLTPYDCYLKHIAQTHNQKEDEVRGKITTLQRRLRPAKRFADSEEMEVYALDKMLESQVLKSASKATLLQGAEIEGMIGYAIERTTWKFRNRPTMNKMMLKNMIWQAFNELPTVADFKQVVRRWKTFLEGSLVEGKLTALKEEITRWQGQTEEDRAHLLRLGLSEEEIEQLAQAATGKTLEQLKAEQKQKLETSLELAYQEHLLRLNKAKRKREQILADYHDGQYLITAKQREIAALLGVGMGTVGKRIAQAKATLMGADIWREILKAFAEEDLIISHPYGVKGVRRICVLSFKKTLRNGVPTKIEQHWWKERLPRIKTLLQTPPIQNRVAQYEQAGMSVVITQHKEEWPCAAGVEQ